MDHQDPRKTVACIIPAHNEAPRIGAILDIVTTGYPFAEIIVADDGSTDGTAEVASRYPGVRVMRFEQNRGKARVMDEAVKACTSDVVFFCDADVTGFTHSIIETIITPVVNGDYDMCIGMRNRKIFVLHATLEIWPLMGGERAMRRHVWEMVPDKYKERFKIEAALNFYAKYYAKGFTIRVFSGLSQVIKEKKYGWVDGFRRRMFMLWDVISAEVSLQRTAVPFEVVNIRRALRAIVTSAFFTVIGFVLMLIGFIGPARVAHWLFDKEIREDPSSPIAHGMIWLAQTLSISAIEVIAFTLIALNGIVVIIQIVNLASLLRHSKWTLKDILLKRGDNEPFFH